MLVLTAQLGGRVTGNGSSAATALGRKEANHPALLLLPFPCLVPLERLSFQRLLQIRLERRVQEFMRTRAQGTQDQFRLRRIVERDDHGIHGPGLDPAHHMLHGFPKLHHFKDHHLRAKPFDFVEKLHQITEFMLLDEKADG